MSRVNYMALTELSPQDVSDEFYNHVRGQLGEKELSDLIFMIMFNAWNRLTIAFPLVPCSADTVYDLDKEGLY